MYELEEHQNENFKLVNHKIATSENQQEKSSRIHNESSIEKLRLNDIQLTNALCILLILGILIACSVTFCITKNPLSFSPIPLLPSAISKLRHRIQVHLYPLSQEEVEIALKDREVEIERINKQGSLVNYAFFTWLLRLLGKHS